MRKLSCNVVDGVKTVLGEKILHEQLVAKVASNALKAWMNIFVLLKIYVDDGVSVAKQSALEYAPEEARSSSYE